MAGVMRLQPVIERAEAVAHSFVAVQKLMWSNGWSYGWPNGHCTVSSLLLNPLLVATQPEQGWQVAVGFYDGKAHAWCESTRGDIVDITWGQFAEHDFQIEHPLRCVIVEEAGPWVAEILLTPEQEDFYRRTIDPQQHLNGRGEASGWSAGSGMRQLFSGYPRAYNASRPIHPRFAARLDEIAEAS